MCQDISPQNIDDTRQAFSIVFLDWERIQPIRFGPIQHLMREHRLQMWPDKRGVVGRHLQQLLQSNDLMQLDQAAFSTGSIAVQGLSAFERLMYAPEFEGTLVGVKQRCAILVSISKNVATISAALVEEWIKGDEPYKDMLIPAPNGPLDNERDTEITTKLLNSLYTQLLVVGTQKLSLPLGIKGKRANPKRAEAWRSGLSLPAIEANLQTAFSIYRIALSPRLDDVKLDQAIKNRFDSLLIMIAETDPLVFSHVNETASRKQLSTIRNEVTAIRGLFANQLSQEIEIPLLFNALDGD